MTSTAAQIDDANLDWHYTRESHPHGVSYRPQSGDTHFPTGFWASERRGAQLQQATPAYTTPVQATSSYIPQVQASASYSHQQAVATSALEDRIATIRIVAHTLGPVATGAPFSQNHWSIFLLIGAAKSFQIDMQTDLRPGIVQGVYKLNQRDYIVSRTAIQWWDTQAIDNPTVAQIEREIRDKGWHRYNMTDTGVGCRHWLLTLLRGFAIRGWVSADDVEGRLQGVLQFNYSKNVAPIVLPIKEGSFF